MTRLAQILTVTQNVRQDVELPGATQALAAIRLYNFSPMTLRITIAGQTPIIPAEMRDIILIDPEWYWDGTFSILPVLDLNQNLGISSTVYIVGYGAGEQIPGSDPAPMTRTVSSTLTATSVVNTGNPPSTPELTGNASGTTGQIIIYNDGSRTTELQNQGGAAIVEQYINGVGVGLASMLLGLQSNQAILTIWGTLGTLLADPNAPLTRIQSDGNGQLTAHIFKSAVSTVGGGPQVCIIMTDAVTSRTWELEIDATTGNWFILETVAAHRFVELDATNNKMILNGMMTMRAGQQETRNCSGRGKAAVAGDVWGFWISYQHDMTNTPSSVTLNQTLNTNVTTAAAIDVTKTGFRLELTATAAGNFVWEGTFSTVGN